MQMRIVTVLNLGEAEAILYSGNPLVGNFSAGHPLDAYQIFC